MRLREEATPVVYLHGGPDATSPGDRRLAWRSQPAGPPRSGRGQVGHARADDASLVGQDHRLGPVAEPEPGKDAAHMGLYGPLGDVEALANLGVGQASGIEREDLALISKASRLHDGTGTTCPAAVGSNPAAPGGAGWRWGRPLRHPRPLHLPRRRARRRGRLLSRSYLTGDARTLRSAGGSCFLGSPRPGTGTRRGKRRACRRARGLSPGPCLVPAAGPGLGQLIGLAEDATGSGSGAHFCEPRSRKVTVKGEGLANPEPPHHDETGGVDEGVAAFVMAAQPTPCLVFSVLVNMTDRQPRQLPNRLEELDSSLMTGAPRKESPRLSDH